MEEEAVGGGVGRREGLWSVHIDTNLLELSW